MLAERSIELSVSPHDDLNNIGFTSFDMVELVLAVESEFNLCIPEGHITPANFRSISTITALVAELQG